MPYLHKFGPNDVLKNRLTTKPQFTFSMYSGSAYLNESRNDGISTGSVNLFEINPGRLSQSFNVIYPFRVKNGDYLRPMGVSKVEYTETELGEQMIGSAILTSSIERYYIPALANPYDPVHGGPPIWGSSFYTPTRAESLPVNIPANQEDHIVENYFRRRKKIIALRNTLNDNKILSPTFDYAYYSGSTVNLLSIPSILFGSGIDPGSVSLKFYYSGSLIDEAKDMRRNGQLISVGSGSNTSGSVVGSVLYNQGFILLTSSYAIAPSYDNYLFTIEDGGPEQFKASWLYFGAYISGSNWEDDGCSSAASQPSYPPGGFPSASSYALAFRGTTTTPMMTMFATAQAQDATNSQNPTWISSSEGGWTASSSFGSGSYQERRYAKITNFSQNQYADYDSPFEKQAFIESIGIYDKDKNLLGVAKLATPVLKKQKDQFTFKITLDM